MNDDLLPPSPPGMGHNQPPEADALAIRVDALVDNADLWAQKKPKITDEDSAKRCDDFIKQLTDEAAHVETERTKLTVPLNEQLNTINGRFRPFKQKIEASLKVLRLLRSRWLEHLDKKQEEERARSAKEAEEKKRKEEEARRVLETAETPTASQIIAADKARTESLAAQQTAANAQRAKPQVKGDFAPKATGFRTHWSCEIENAKEALIFLHQDPTILEALQNVGNRLAREQHEQLAVPGLKIVKTRA